MKKAYNVYSILGKAVSKAAMLTSVFALCFLFSGQMFGQKLTQANSQQQIGMEYQIGEVLPHGVLPTNLSNLDPVKTEKENALEIIENLRNAHVASFDPDARVSEEMEYELNGVLLTTFGKSINDGVEFNASFSRATAALARQYNAYDTTLYNGPGVEAIAKNLLTNFF